MGAPVRPGRSGSPPSDELGALLIARDRSCRCTDSSCARLITGPMKVAGSAGSPTPSRRVRSTNRSTNSSCSVRSTMIRLAIMQIWPELKNEPNTADSTACVEVGVVEHDQWRVAAQFEQQPLEARPRAMLRPVSVEPVNDTTRGCRVGDQGVADVLRRARRRR